MKFQIKTRIPKYSDRFHPANTSLELLYYFLLIIVIKMQWCFLHVYTSRLNINETEMLVLANYFTIKGQKKATVSCHTLTYTQFFNVSGLLRM